MSSHKPQVCVVDDDESVRRGVRRYLMASGCDVCVFESAEAFLAAEHPQRGFCIVADLVMPGMDGFAFLAELKCTRPGIPVILISAHDAPETRQRAADLGAAAFFRKPVDGEDLLEAIRRVLRAGREADEQT